MKLSIVIVNYNTPKDTIECLTSIKKAALPDNWELQTIVVDNGSKDNSVHELSAKFPEVKMIITGKNLGFAGGNNIGISTALKDKHDWVLLINSDTYIDKDFFKDFDNDLPQFPAKTGIVCPMIYFAPGFEYHNKRYTQKDLGKVVWYGGGQIDWNNVYASHKHVDEVDRGQFEEIVETDYATGAAMFIRTDVLKQIGLLNDNYFLYLEDLEFNIRAKKAGWKVLFDPKPKLWHKVSRSSGGIGSRLNDYFITRNRLMFGLTFTKPRTKFALLREAGRLLQKGNPTQKQAIKDYFLHRYGKGTFFD